MRLKLPSLDGMYTKELRSFCTGEASLHHVLEAHSGSHLLTNPRLKSWVYKEDVILLLPFPLRFYAFLQVSFSLFKMLYFLLVI